MYGFNFDRNSEGALFSAFIIYLKVFKGLKKRGASNKEIAIKISVAIIGVLIGTIIALNLYKF